MNELLMPALGMVNEVFESYEELEEIPFELTLEEYLNYATMQFSKRFQRIQRAQEQSVEQVYHIEEEE
jgi:ribonucleoside-diphosphate reductase beta chain